MRRSEWLLENENLGSRKQEFEEEVEGTGMRGKDLPSSIIPSIMILIRNPLRTK